MGRKHVLEGVVWKHEGCCGIINPKDKMAMCGCDVLEPIEDGSWVQITVEELGKPPKNAGGATKEAVQHES